LMLGAKLRKEYL